MASPISSRGTYILIRDNLDVLNVTGSLEDLTENILCDTLVEAANVQSTLVRFGGSTSESSSTCRRHQSTLIGRKGRGNRSRDRVGILRDMQRRRREVGCIGLAILVAVEARGARIGLGRWWQLAGVGGSAGISHLENLFDDE